MVAKYILVQNGVNNMPKFTNRQNDGQILFVFSMIAEEHYEEIEQGNC